MAAMGSRMVTNPVVDAAAEMVPVYRAHHPGAGELVLVLPRWLWNRYGQEGLTSSLQRLGVQHVKVIEDWVDAHGTDAKFLLYEAGTWHTNHHIGDTSPSCEGCQHAS